MKFKFTVVFTLFVCWLGESEAQGISDFRHQSKTEHKINLSFTPQLFLNHFNVENDGKYPEIISTRNTIGRSFGLEYERISKRGLILNVAGYYSTQVHDVDVTYKSLDFFDTINKEELSQHSVQIKYGFKERYVGLKFMAGYRWTIPATFLKGLRLEMKAGFSTRTGLNDSSDFVRWMTLYERSPNYYYLSSFGDDAVSFGSRFTVEYTSWWHNVDLYLGLNKAVNWSLIKDVNLGITATRAFRTRYNINSITRDLSSRVVSQDSYKSRDISLGVKLSIGLWYR